MPSYGKPKKPKPKPKKPTGTARFNKGGLMEKDK